jgi:hypothetical protein
MTNKNGRKASCSKKRRSKHRKKEEEPSQNSLELPLDLKLFPQS